MRGQRGVLHNLSILTVGQIASQLANVAALIFLARYLGAHWFGVVQVGVAFMAYALITAEWGMMALGIREISRLDDPGDILRYARTHVGVLALQTAVVAAAGLLLLPRLPFYRHDPVIFLLYLATVLPQVYMHYWIAMGLERMTWVGVFKASRSLLYALFILGVLPLVTDRETAAAARWVPAMFLVAMMLSNLTVNIPLARWFGQWIHPARPRLADIRARWRESASIGANSVVLRVLYNIDILLLGVLVSPDRAGTYAAAARVIFFLVVAVEVLWAALLPRLSRMVKESARGFRLSFNLYFGTVVALLMPVAAGGWLLGPEIITFVYRGQYDAAGPIFSYLAISYSLLAAATFLGNTLLAEDRQRSYFLPLVLSSAVAVTGILLRVPDGGGLGASRAMLLAHGLLFLILAVLNRRNFNRLLAETLAAAAVAVAIMTGLLTVWTDGPVLLRIGGAGGLYLALVAGPLLRLRSRTFAAGRTGGTG